MIPDEAPKTAPVSLSPDFEARLNALWLQAMQREIGTLKSDLQAAEIRNALLIERMGFDAALIEALKERAFAAEDGNRALREHIATLQKPKPRRRRHDRMEVGA